MKSTGTAYLLLLLFGFLGVHKFYLNKVGMGILYLFTFGFLGIGLFIDLFTLSSQVSDYNRLHYGFRDPSYNNTNENSKPNVSGENFLDQLEKLNNLKDAGVLTQKEFEDQKKKLLS